MCVQVIEPGVCGSIGAKGMITLKRLNLSPVHVINTSEGALC